VPKSSERLKELLAVFIWEAIKASGAPLLVSLILFLVGGKKGSESFIHSHPRLMGALLGGFISAVLLRVYYTMRYHALPKLEHDFDQISRDISFEYHDRQTYTYRKHILLRARRSGLTSYHDKFKWTGANPPAVRSAIEDQTIQMTEKKSVWQLYVVHFPLTLNKGDTIDTEVIFDLKEPDQSFVPFISTNIEEPTKKLSLKLKVVPDVGINHAFCEVANCMGARVPYWTEKKSVNRSGEVLWEPKPEMHRYYEMHWKPKK
jgi:hypothetical protein